MNARDQISACIGAAVDRNVLSRSAGLHVSGRCMACTLMLALISLMSGFASAAPVVAGRTDGVWYWTLANTANGLQPSQSWSGASAAPNGDIYVAGMDHTTNSALYRMRGDVLSYLGDARAASTAAGNWQSGEIAEKFHTRPVWLDGRVYVATLSSSELDARYLSLRGFHWYAQLTASDQFVDLSAGQPGGTGAEHGGLIAIVADEARKLVYGVLSPTGELYRYDPANGASTRIGRPDYQRSYVYPGRALWVDSRGRVYFSAGNDDEAYYATPYAPAIFNHIRYYDPSTGSFGERTDWLLHDQRAIDASRCFPASGVCYLMDNVGHVYRFDEVGPRWTYLGSIGQANSRTYGYAWVFQVSDDQKTAWIATQLGQLFEFDLASGTVRFSTNLKDAEPNLASKSWFYGYNAWVGSRFYFCAFNPTGNAQLVAIDPARLKTAITRGVKLYVSTAPTRANPVPLDGNTLSGSAYLFTSPDTGVTRVAFDLDSAAFRVESLAPFDFAGTATGGTALPLNVTSLSNGRHVAGARVTMASGPAFALNGAFLVGSAPPPPSFALYRSPGPDRVNPVPLQAWVSGGLYAFTSPDSGLARVEFSIDGALIRTENQAPFDLGGTATNGLAQAFNTFSLTPGMHTVSARATMSGGAQQTASADITVAGLYLSTSANRSGAVALNGRVVGTGRIYVFTSPDAGVTRVQFWLDGNLVKTENLGPFDLAGTAGDGNALPFDAATLSPGAHTLRAQMTLGSGAVFETSAAFSR